MHHSFGSGTDRKQQVTRRDQLFFLADQISECQQFAYRLREDRLAGMLLQVQLEAMRLAEAANEEPAVPPHEMRLGESSN